MKKIRPLRPIIADTAQQRQELLNGLHQILSRNSSHLSFEQLYRYSYNACLARQGQLLHKETLDTVLFFLDGLHPKTCADLVLHFGELLVAIEMIRDVLMYMDKTMHMDVYKDMLALYTSVYRRCMPVPEILGLIKAYRRGEAIDSSVLKKAVDMLNLLELENGTVYKLEFEQVFMAETVQFYTEKCDEWLQLGCESFFENASEKIASEQEWISWLSKGSLDLLTETLLDTCIKQQIAQIVKLGTGPVFMFTNENIPALELVYEMVGRVEGGLDEIKNALGEHIDTLMPLTPQEKDKQAPLDWIEYFCALIKRTNRVLDEAFKKDLSFKSELYKRIQSLINSDQKAPEYLALYIDDHMRKQKQDFVQYSEKTLLILQFLTEKDVFERYYKRHLARRLINRQVDDESETGMISKIKGECGSRFTFQMEGMFNDVKLSNDMAQEFKGQSDIVAVTVLTATFWPARSVPLEIPADLRVHLDRFSTFYHAKHTGRKLDWVYSMGNADVYCNLPNGRKLINLSTLGMLVLIGHFNKHESRTFNEILEQSGIAHNELTRTLLSLSAGKHKLLIKSKKEKKISPDEKFSVNLDFKSPLSKIKIGNLVQIDPEERKETIDMVIQDRKHVVEACIVRIMKARQTLSHVLLVAQVLEQMDGFKPSPSFIKERIEGLIEREYLKRSDDL